MPMMGGEARRAEAPSRDELVARARWLAPAVRERAARAESERRVPKESIDEIVGAGLGRALQPARWGGWELGHEAAFDVAVEIAAACGSTGWCASLLNIHDWWLAAFPEEAQHDVWRDSPDRNISAMVYPTGKAQPVDGGYRLDGRWTLVSGVDHSHWSIVAALVMAESGPPQVRQFLLPRTDYTVIDTWFNVGMRGTGSNDLAAEGVFVPAHRTLAMDAFREGRTPGAEINKARCYQVPMLAAFPHALAGPALGIGRGAFADWLDWTRGRTATATGEPVGETAPVQIRLAQAEAGLDAAELLLRRNLEALEADEPPDLATRARSSASYAYAVQEICRVVDSLLNSSGARGLRDGNVIQRCWRDVHAAAAHIGLSPDLSGQLRGRALLGLPRDSRVRMY
jgi:3-hydroxy-9,10-secoandrosta-1,3,5(10)-triene-9,17-dione monooxygenase